MFILYWVYLRIGDYLISDLINFLFSPSININQKLLFLLLYITETTELNLRIDAVGVRLK